MTLRVLRVYHAGGGEGQHGRELALAAYGADLTLAVPASWPSAASADNVLAHQALHRIELEVVRTGDVNRHAYRDESMLTRVIRNVGPDVLDLHEEPFSVAARQWLRAAPVELPVIIYTAQNVDKRYPPPFSWYERSAHARAAALYPCSRQAASVARGKGYAGFINVIPLGFDPEVFHPGQQALHDDELIFVLSGRLLPEKGVSDAVRVLAEVNRIRPATLFVIGSGPEEGVARGLAAALGVDKQLRIVPWQPAHEIASTLRNAHVVLVPSRSTPTWTEQFGRVILEAQASGAVVAGYASGAIPEVVGSSGVLAREGDIDALSTSVVALLNDPDEWARLREQGIALSMARTWDLVAEQHADLYRQVVEGDTRLDLPQSPRKRRSAARGEFGETAATPVGKRPFALPLLRRGGVIARALAGLIDAGAEVAALLRSLRGGRTDQKAAS
jgi:glycosyltransferase involved in cell wall biosynthesis